MEIFYPQWSFCVEKLTALLKILLFLKPPYCHAGKGLDDGMFDDGMVWKSMVEIYARKSKRNRFQKSLMVMDAFKAYFKEDEAAKMLTDHNGVVKVTAGCASKKQIL